MMTSFNKSKVIRNKLPNSWALAIIIAALFDVFHFVMLNLLNPAGNDWTITEYAIMVGASLISIGAVYVCTRVVHAIFPSMRSGYQYGLALLFSVPFFCIVYLSYWVIIVRKMMYGLPTDEYSYLPQLAAMTNGLHIPVASIIMIVMYNNQAHRSRLQLAQAENLVTEAQLKSLQQQVDPHFLFNSLNILSALISIDTQKSVLFTQKLSEVYRFFLKTQKETVIPLYEELSFANDYFYLAECRFGPAFALEIDESVKTIADNHYVIPGTIQQLIENVIKHNGGDEASPIIIRIYTKDSRLCVMNRLQRKENTGSGYGLRNLAERYSLLKRDSLHYFEKDQHFYVSVPLIKNLAA